MSAIPIGDIITVCSLVVQLYNKLADGPAELQEARNQLSSLKTALDAITEDLNDPSSNLRTHTETFASLEVVIQGSKGTLNELSTIVEKYAKADVTKKFSFRTAKFSLTDSQSLSSIRDRLMLHAQSINLILKTAQNAIIGRIQTSQDKGYNDILSKLDQMLTAKVDEEGSQQALCPVCNTMVGFKVAAEHMGSHSMESRMKVANEMLHSGGVPVRT
ncbi:hypothetical protein FPQ18DRAFT_380714 [Pyronema domesticum]|nr:hypothetical protein FPQ18DRAFT_380714 [Pyronema domesticum]